jgi:hypothetical protein
LAAKVVRFETLRAQSKPILAPEKVNNPLTLAHGSLAERR